MAAAPPSLSFRLADPLDAAMLHAVRQAAIRRLTRSHFSAEAAESWAGLGGIRRVQLAIANDEVWVATLGSRVVGWIQRAANSIEGLYVSPQFARQGVGTALVGIAERSIARSGYRDVVLESSRNAVEFYRHLDFAATGVCKPSGSAVMRKRLGAAR